MHRPHKIPLMALGTALLCGCAATSRSTSTVPERGPDCSFRSATTCWTLAGRFPAPRPDARDSVPNDIRNEPPVLAKGSDSAGE
jgi:hypothetical protein